MNKSRPFQSMAGVIVLLSCSAGLVLSYAVDTDPGALRASASVCAPESAVGSQSTDTEGSKAAPLALTTPSTRRTSPDSLSPGSDLIPDAAGPQPKAVGSLQREDLRDGALGFSEYVERYTEDGQRDGLYRIWWPGTDHLFEEGRYRDGKEEGVWYMWRQNGTLLSSLSFSDGMMNGPSMSWYEDGGLMSEGSYKNGREHSTWSSYHNNGQLRKHGSYDSGIRVRTWTWYHDNGCVARIGQYADVDGDPTDAKTLLKYLNKENPAVWGKKVGFWYTYNSQGILQEVVDHSN